MGTMFPTSFPREEEQGRWAEAQVFNAFRQLDDEWQCFYSVPWQSRRKGRQGDGEADFVLVHPNQGLFIVEVKGGSTIELKDGEWFTWSQGTPKPIKNPFEQAKESKYALWEHLVARLPSLPKGVTLGHFVVFPSHEQEGDLGPDGPRILILDKLDLRDPGQGVGRIASHWNSSSPSTRLTTAQLKEIKQVLAPDVRIKRTLRFQVEDINERLNQLTDEQARSMRLFRKQRRVLVLGAAGTGKTVLAMARARELAADGFRTLLVCFNAPLGERLREEMADESLIVAGSFHSVCREFAERADMLPPGPIDSEWWDVSLPETFSEAAFASDRLFDAIIIDEAQDFHPDWWDYLELSFANASDGIMSVFGDANQDIYRGQWRAPFDADPVVLETNCRNTVEIAERTNCLLRTDQPTLGTHGVSPTFKVADTPNQFSKALDASLRKFLVDDGLSAEQVVVLTTRRADVEQLAGSHGEGTEVGDGRNGTVLVETVHRFKGLEADAVILLLHEQDPEEVRRLAYIGMSRARALLHVVGSSSIRALLEWPN
jgi:Nuclease-related domain/UvrD-like helicase C-terminal domain/AAA domain